MQIDEASDGQQVELDPGGVLEVRLDENPTTGFRWNVVAAGEPTCALEHDGFEAGRGSHGTAGSHVWQFRAVQAGESVIEMRYRRPWEADDGPGRGFRTTVRVRGA